MVTTQNNQIKSDRPINNHKLLSITDLHVDFPSREGVVRATSGASFDVMQGETLGLVGESGCGKSVTAQAILRIIPRPGKIVRGSILFLHTDLDGNTNVVDIAGLREHSVTMDLIRKKEISLIMQEPMSALSPVHTVGNQLIEKITLSTDLRKNAARDRAIELLHMVGIPKASQRVDTYTFELSGGMRQRAMIAMALASSPKLLIADEPTTAVDVTIQAQILRLLRQLQNDLGMSVLMITHDLGVVANLAHRVAVMYRGKVVEKGPVKDIYQTPKHPYTQGLLGSIPDLADTPGTKIPTIPGVVPHPYAVVKGCEFHTRCRFMIRGICDQESPDETVISPEHTVRCFLYNSKE